MKRRFEISSCMAYQSADQQYPLPRSAHTQPTNATRARGHDPKSGAGERAGPTDERNDSNPPLKFPLSFVFCKHGTVCCMIVETPRRGTRVLRPRPPWPLRQLLQPLRPWQLSSLRTCRLLRRSPAEKPPRGVKHCRIWWQPAEWRRQSNRGGARQAAGGV